MAQGSTNAVTGKSGGMLPSWWMEERTLTAGERIEQYAPIEYREYQWEDRMLGQAVEGLGPATVGASMSRDERYVAIVNDTEPYLHLYMDIEENGVYTPSSNIPSDLPAGKVLSAEFSPDGRYLAVCMGTSPYLFVYRVGGPIYSEIAGNGGSWHLFLSRISNPDIPISVAPYYSRFSPDGEHIVVRTDDSTGLVIYKMTYPYEMNIGLSKLPLTATVASTSVAPCTVFSPDGELLLVTGNSGDLLILRRTEDGNYEQVNETTFFNVVPTESADARFAFSDTGEYLAYGRGGSAPTTPATSGIYRIYQRREDKSGYDLRWDLSGPGFGGAPEDTPTALGTNAYGRPLIPTNAEWALSWRGSTTFALAKYYGDDHWHPHPAPPELLPSGTIAEVILSRDGKRLYVFTNDTTNPVLMYAVGREAMASNMRDAKLCKRMALNPAAWYGMGIALAAADEGEEFLAGLFTPINDAVRRDLV